MVRWRASFVLGGVLSASVVNALRTQEEYDEINRNVDCDNDCFFSSFINGACAEDVACMCTKNKYREDYFCCLASCAASVLPDSLERQTTACKAHGFDMNFVNFDTEKVCGIKQKPYNKTTKSSDATVTVTTIQDDVMETSASTTATSVASSSSEASQDGKTRTSESSAENTSDKNNDDENEDEGDNGDDKNDSGNGGDDGSNAASGRPALYGAGLLLGAWAFALSQ